MVFARAKRFLLGEPLTAQQDIVESIRKRKAVAILSSDALSSVAYATDAMLAVLVTFSASALMWSIPIAIGIALLLAILVSSYHRVIDAYPTGGGAYAIAKENIGIPAGLVAAAALLIDYVLTVSVSTASGIENLGAAFPVLCEHKELCGALLISALTFVNLRGVRNSYAVFALPTYFFVLSVLALIGVSAWRLSRGEVMQVPPTLSPAFQAVPLILVLRAFASGCSALTGIEAISNNVRVFRSPSVRNAKVTLTWMAVLLAFLFLGVTVLARMYGIVPTQGETIISLLGRAVFGNSIFYYVLQIATALILVVAANTSYSRFPMLASWLAKDRFLPRQMASLGDRLVFSNGIAGLSFASIVLLVLFKGETIHLIPLYAVGVFLSFSLSQVGMIIHHLKGRKPGWQRSLVINSVGACTTGIVLINIAVSKFTHGAWGVILAIPLMALMFRSIHRHYLATGRQLTVVGQQPWAQPQAVKHTVIIPISGIHRGVLAALRYAVSISGDVRACYVETNPAVTATLKAEWEKWARNIPFVVLKSRYRSVLQPLLEYVDDIKETTHDDMVTVLIPEFVTTRWWHRILHNQTAIFLRTALAYREGVVVTSVRYHLKQ